MNIALFGGTFDPVHTGHLRAAWKAARAFRLDRVLFAPSGTPPHKHKDHVTPYAHRFAMVSLACAREPRFVPSLLEAPSRSGRPQYSIDTLRAVKKSLSAKDRLYFLMGLDAFLDLPQWKEPDRLLELADFIVVSRPGFRPRDMLNVVPSHELKADRLNPRGIGKIILRCTTLHVLSGVNLPVASREIRQALRRGRAVSGLIPALVEEYIMKEGFYRPTARRGSRP